MLNKDQYWEQLVDYYYDHIHWNEPGPTSIYKWLERDYHASTNMNTRYIHFDDEARKAWFVMRWSK